jgi:hypothetical protein
MAFPESVLRKMAAEHCAEEIGFWQAKITVSVNLF